MKKTVTAIAALALVLMLTITTFASAQPTDTDSGGYAVAYGVVYAPTDNGYSVEFASGNGWYVEDPCPHADGQPVVVVYDTLYSTDPADWQLVIIVPVDPATIPQTIN